MTEAEWFTSTDPQAMLTFLREHGMTSERKLRLFAVACCRRVAHCLVESESRNALEVSERFADGSADRRELSAARKAVKAPYRNRRRAAIRATVLRETGDATQAEARAACWAGAWDTAHATVRAVAFDAARYTAEAAAVTVPCCARNKLDFAGRKAEGAVQASLLRCLFGALSFREGPEPGLWRTPTVVQLASAIYEEQDWGLLQVLGDALEEAGCADTDALNHCRQPGVHARGCWVVDHILCKA